MNLIQDTNTRDAINKVEKRLDRIESVKQLPSDTTLAQLIDIVNKITDNMKRTR